MTKRDKDDLYHKLQAELRASAVSILARYCYEVNKKEFINHYGQISKTFSIYGVDDESVKINLEDIELDIAQELKLLQAKYQGHE